MSYFVLLINNLGLGRESCFSAIDYSQFYCFSVRKNFLFFWILRKGCIIYFLAHPGPSILSRYNGKL